MSHRGLGLLVCLFKEPTVVFVDFAVLYNGAEIKMLFFVSLLVYQCFSTPVFFQTQKVSSSLCYEIHYWIGSQSTQDEQGAAAVYTIQLDEFLGCTPVQHREVQNHESDTFKGYFKQGIM